LPLPPPNVKPPLSLRLSSPVISVLVKQLVNIFVSLSLTVFRLAGCSHCSALSAASRYVGSTATSCQLSSTSIFFTFAFFQRNACWMRSSRLQLNTQKTEVLWCTSNLTSHPCYPMFFYHRPRFRRRGCLCLERASPRHQIRHVATCFRRRLKTHPFDKAYNC